MTGGSREGQQGSEGWGQLLLRKIPLVSSRGPVEELYISTPPSLVGWLQRDGTTGVWRVKPWSAPQEELHDSHCGGRNTKYNGSRREG